MLENVSKSFKDIDEFMEYLEERNTSMLQADLDSVMFGVENGELTLKANGVEHFVRITALPSILQRFGVNGKAFKVLSNGYDEELASILNTLLSHVGEDAESKVIDKNKRTVRIMITDDAVNSINSAIYSHIPMTDIVDSLLDVIDNASYFDEGINCSIETDYANSELVFSTDKKVKFCDVDDSVIIKLQSSENGMGSVSISAGLKGSAYYLPILAPNSTIHKGNNGLKDVIDDVNQFEASLSGAIFKAHELEKIKVTNPEKTATIIGRKVGLGSKYIDYVIESINGLSPESLSKLTMAEIYSMFNSAIFTLCKGNKDTILNYQNNNLLKILGIHDWEKYL